MKEETLGLSSQVERLAQLAPQETLDLMGVLTQLARQKPESFRDLAGKLVYLISTGKTVNEALMCL